jgi:hypothetical protein
LTVFSASLHHSGAADAAWGKSSLAIRRFALSLGLRQPHIINGSIDSRILFFESPVRINRPAPFCQHLDQPGHARDQSEYQQNDLDHFLAIPLEIAYSPLEMAINHPALSAGRMFAIDAAMDAIVVAIESQNSVVL